MAYVDQLPIQRIKGVTSALMGQTHHRSLKLSLKQQTKNIIPQPPQFKTIPIQQNHCAKVLIFSPILLKLNVSLIQPPSFSSLM